MLLILLFLNGVVVAATDKSDIRVLIDISGSMRQNDPDNLRRPALRMLTGLMQPGTRAGVWTFARWVNNLVPVAEVDAAWKKRTQSLSKQIASPGQFTNIEEVLDKASLDWEGEPTTHARHLVLLTDGMVDVSKIAAENAASRSRILEKLLPRMVAGGVKVHTIALSPRADHELMKRLAGETGGWYQQVDRADELQRVFLRMFEQVGAPDTVPLADNRFIVDGAISEATVLAFRKPGSPPVVLRSPSGDTFNDSDLPAGIAWYRDQGYDMITIASPEKGEWTLQADLDPDNRVLVVTDLKLQTSEVPTHIAVGETARIEASLNNKGKVVTRKAFLRLLEARAEAVTMDGTQPVVLNDLGEGDDTDAADGRYTMRFGEQRAQDDVELLVAFESPTFMRERRMRVAVHEVVEGRVSEGAEGALLELQLQGSVMQPEVALSAWQEPQPGQRSPLLAVAVGDGVWSAPLLDAEAPSYVSVSGKSRLGNLIERTVGPFMPPGIEPPPAVIVAPPEPVVAEPPESEPAPEPTPAPAAEVPAEPEEAPVEEEGWMVPAIVFGGFNLLLLIGGGVWFFLRRRRAGDGDAENDLEKLIDEVAPAPATEDAATQEDAA